MKVKSIIILLLFIFTFSLYSNSDFSVEYETALDGKKAELYSAKEHPFYLFWRQSADTLYMEQVFLDGGELRSFEINFTKGRIERVEALENDQFIVCSIQSSQNHYFYLSKNVNKAFSVIELSDSRQNVSLHHWDVSKIENKIYLIYTEYLNSGSQLVRVVYDTESKLKTEVVLRKIDGYMAQPEQIFFENNIYVIWKERKNTDSARILFGKGTEDLQIIDEQSFGYYNYLPGLTIPTYRRGLEFDMQRNEKNFVSYISGDTLYIAAQEIAVLSSLSPPRTNFIMFTFQTDDSTLLRTEYLEFPYANYIDDIQFINESTFYWTQLSYSRKLIYRYDYIDGGYDLLTYTPRTLSLPYISPDKSDILYYLQTDASLSVNQLVEQKIDTGQVNPLFEKGNVAETIYTFVLSVILSVIKAVFLAVFMHFPALILTYIFLYSLTHVRKEILYRYTRLIVVTLVVFNLATIGVFPFSFADMSTASSYFYIGFFLSTFLSLILTKRFIQDPHPDAFLLWKTILVFVIFQFSYLSYPEWMDFLLNYSIGRMF